MDKEENIVEGMLEARWVEVVDVFRVESANINAGEGGPTEIDVKTIHLEDGTVVPRISPQAIFRMIRDYWIDEGLQVDIAREEAGKAAPLPECDPKKFIDDDLFGYLKARGGRTGETGVSESRSGPIRSVGAIGMFEYPDDIDFMTSIVSTTGKEEGGSMVTRRIYTNTFILPIWCDMRRIGRKVIHQKDKTLKFENIVDSKERKKRFQKFLEAVFYLGKFAPGAYKQPLPPKLLMIGVFSKPNIMLYDALQNDLTVRLKEVRLQKEFDERRNEEKVVSIASGKVVFSIELNSLLEKINLYANDIINIYIGIMESFFDKSVKDYQEEINSLLNKNNSLKVLKGKIHIKKLSDLKNNLLSS